MNIADLYSTRIQKTFDEDHEEIASILKANPKATLKMINYYKGLPITYPASINSVDRKAVELAVKAEQAFAIEKSRSAFLRSPLFKHDIFAQIQYVNIKKQVAIFSKLAYVEIMAERRNFIRMMPEPEPKAVIDSPLGIVEGRVYDLSLTGLNILIDNSCPLERGTEASIWFMLRDYERNADERIVVPAKLHDIKGDSRPYSYKFSISVDKTLERQMSKYIFQRQIEVMKEIKEAVC